MTTLLTGGAGFIGANLADRLLDAGERVRILDDLSQPYAERNLTWLRARHASKLDVVIADVRDAAAVCGATKNVTSVFHLAAQVSIEASFADPAYDFDVNARGTLHVLEAARACKVAPAVVVASSSKVYGALGDLVLRRSGSRYEPDDEIVGAHGIDEQRAIDPHSPHACSKAAAERYVLDYAQNFALPAIVMRIGTVYGPRQLGDDEHGWVACFALRALRGDTITVHGDGRQVRDLLHVDDLVDAMLLARHAMPRIAGHAFNVGGGPRAASSLLELVDRVAASERRTPPVRFAPWRLGDERFYVSDVTKMERLVGWKPRIGVDEGISRLVAALRDGGGFASEGRLLRAQETAP
jgi:CDP-paratose 2-epimerase